VAEHHRLPHHERADLAVRVIVHVAAADADRVDLHLDAVGADLQGQVDIAERQLALPLKDECAHGGVSSGLAFSVVMLTVAPSTPKRLD
jgi:hypothetical protein